MATEKGYSGWATYETWAVALWIDNDRGLYETVREMAAEVKTSYSTTHRDKHTRSDAQVELADRIKDLIDDAQPDLGATLWADLMNGALSEVDWDEIAEHYLED